MGLRKISAAEEAEGVEDIKKSVDFLEEVSAVAGGEHPRSGQGSESYADIKCREGQEAFIQRAQWVPHKTLVRNLDCDR